MGLPSGTNSGHGRNPVSGGNRCAGHLGSTTPQNRVSSAITLLSVVDRAAHERGRALSLSQPRKELCPTPKGDGTKRPEPPRGPRLSPKSIPDSLAPVRVLIHRGGAYLLIYFLSCSFPGHTAPVDEASANPQTSAATRDGVRPPVGLRCSR